MTLPSFVRRLLPLACAALLAAATPARAQSPVLDKVVRWWSFFQLTEGSRIEERIGKEHVQVGGVVDATHDYGPLSVAPPGQGERAEGRVHSTETGATYWVSTQAPNGNVAQGEPIGNSVELRQFQYFTKTHANAQLRLVVTEVTLEGLDYNGNIPNDTECPWREPGSSYLPCRRIMNASVWFEVTAFSIFDQKKFLTTGGTAELVGFRGFWDRDARTGYSATVPFWDRGSFQFEPDVDANGGGHARMTLVEPITIEVPLGSIGLENSFYVSAIAKASTYNRRQRESYLGSKFRDPVEIGGVEFSYTGVVPIDTPLEQPAAIAPAPAPPCRNGRRQAAGKLQFEARAYEAPELPGLGAAVVVTRTGGRRGAVSATIATTDGTAIAGEDYTALATHVLFADGEEGRREVRIPILADDLAEPDKTLTLTLSDPMGCAALGRKTSTVLTILDDDSPVVPPTYTVGGTVTGLLSTGLVLREAVTGETLEPAAGPFAFTYPFDSGSPYDVRVVSQPDDPVQLCTVTHGTGTVGDTDVTDVEVHCVTPPGNGALDSTFGGDGRVTLPGATGASALALQTDGKLVVVGSRTLARYNADGTPDAGFGTGGQVTVVFNGMPQDAANAVAIQPDGKILVAGVTRTTPTRDDFALARYHADGSPDTGFGTDGHASVDFGNFTDRAFAVLVQADGGIVLAGHAAVATPLGLNNFAAARFTSAGVLDTTFGTGGKVTTNIAGDTDLAYAAALQPDDKIVIAGRVANGGADNPDVGLLRYNADGSLDSSFGNNGTVRVDLSGASWDEASDLALQADGRIVVAVQASVGGSFRFRLARFDADGHLDGTFGSAGVVTTAFGTLADYVRAVAIQGDGKIVAAGQSTRSGAPGNDMAVARYNADGSPDATFGTDGKVTVDFYASNDGGECVAAQPDGRIIVGGFARDGTSNTLALMRLVP